MGPGGLATPETGGRLWAGYGPPPPQQAALFTQGLMALLQPIICCVRAQSAREFVTEFSGGATPHRSGVAQRARKSSELATQGQAHRSSQPEPHSRLMMPVLSFVWIAVNGLAITRNARAIFLMI
jgi:hypothetical protein